MANETITEHVVEEVTHEVQICDKCGREAGGRQITLSVDSDVPFDTADLTVTQDVCDECLEDALDSGSITELERIHPDDIAQLDVDSVLTLRPAVSRTERHSKEATMRIRQYAAVLTLMLWICGVVAAGYSLFLSGGTLLISSLLFLGVLYNTKHIRDEMADLYEETNNMCVDDW